MLKKLEKKHELLNKNYRQRGLGVTVIKKNPIEINNKKKKEKRT